MLGKRVVGYYQSWAEYRNGKGKCSVSHINPNLYTHLIYCFIGVTQNGEIELLDKNLDIDKGAMKKFNELKRNNKRLKTMVSMGGAKAGTERFAHIVEFEDRMRYFATNVVIFVQNEGFDGFDLDWEYPENYKHSFSSLVKILSEKLKEKGLLFSVAVAAGLDKIDACYDADVLEKYCDFINVMAYDYHGSWDKVTGHNAPLYRGETDKTDYQKKLNVHSTIDYWIRKGIPASKLNLGIATYGRTFTLQSSRNNGVGAPVIGPGRRGSYIPEHGVLGYNEISEQMAARKWKYFWSEEQRVPYASAGDQWLSYDNTKSVEAKGKYIRDKGLGGAVIWAIDFDDFRNKYPLTSKIRSLIH